jgi:hypothetical protein
VPCPLIAGTNIPCPMPTPPTHTRKGKENNSEALSIILKKMNMEKSTSTFKYQINKHIERNKQCKTRCRLQSLPNEDQ